MWYAIMFCFFVLIFFISARNEEKKQEKLEEKISHLAYQRDDLCKIIRYLFDKTPSGETEKNIKDITEDILVRYSADEEITNRLDNLCRRINS